MEELKKISDSGVYETLTLSRVISGEEEDGIFHDNTILTVELASPYFRSQLPVERFEIYVMKHKVPPSGNSLI